MFTGARFIVSSKVFQSSDHYYEMIYANFPEKIADYIIDLEPDYFRPDENKLKDFS